LVNTADDGAAEVETLAGPDGIIGTGDDQVFALDTFTREVLITDIGPNLRQVQVLIRYRVGHLNRQYDLVAFISSFA
jgi:hypothetical protein